MKIRYCLAQESQHKSTFSGKVEVDESYFGARRIKGNRRRTVIGKRIVLHIYQRNDKVFTEIVPNIQKKTLQAVIDAREHQNRSSFQLLARLQRALVDLDYPKYFRLNQSAYKFATKDSNINGIESF